jgi:hypothetical protein
LPEESMPRIVSVPPIFSAYIATYPAGGVSGVVTLEKLTCPPVVPIIIFALLISYIKFSNSQKALLFVLTSMGLALLKLPRLL